MTFPAVAPLHWPRFQQIIRNQAPAFPLPRPNPTVSRMDQATQAIGLLTTILSAAGVPIPPIVDMGSAAASIRGPSDLAHGGVDIAAGNAVGAFVESGMGPAPAMIVGNGIAVLRGAVQAIGRSDEMEDFLQQIIAYVETLARTAIQATHDNHDYVTLPQPMVPTDSAAGGAVTNARQRGSYRQGYNRINTVIRDIDSVRLTSGPPYSKMNFLHLYMQGNPNLTQPQQRRYEFRVRARLEGYIVATILARDLVREREQMRRWAMTG